jgi:hypothetical protein
LRQSTGSLTIYGDVYGGTSSQVGVGCNGTGTVVIHGNVFTPFGGYGIEITANQNVTLNGNVQPMAASGIQISATSPQLTVNGDVIAGMYGGNGIYVYYASSGAITVNGNVLGGFADSGTVGIQTRGCNTTVNGDVAGRVCYGMVVVDGTVTVNGNVRGGSYSPYPPYGNGINISSSSATVTVNGVVGPVTTTQLAPAIYCSVSGAFVTVNGTILGGRKHPACSFTAGKLRIIGEVKWNSGISDTAAVDASGSAIVIMEGNIKTEVSPGVCEGYVLIQGRLVYRNAQNYFTHYAEDNGSGHATGNPVPHDGTVRAGQNFPASSDVRLGVTYGPVFEYAGTCAIPPANRVSIDVPVDNTYGTAILDTASAQDAVWQADIDGNLSAKQLLALIGSAHLGQLAGAGTSTINIKAANDGSTTRITATVDSLGNRNAVVLNPP